MFLVSVEFLLTPEFLSKRHPVGRRRRKAIRSRSQRGVSNHPHLEQPGRVLASPLFVPLRFLPAPPIGFFLPIAFPSALVPILLPHHCLSSHLPVSH
jgi:hypothetical protein